MTLPEVIKRHGKELGAIGVAVYAFISANPGATYAAVAEGLDMGESTVKKAVRQLEDLGLAARTIETTPTGLHLPTTLKTTDPVIKERGISREPRPPQNPVITERPVNKGQNSPDPVIKERGHRGTRIAPSKAETIQDLNTSQPSSTTQVGAGATAPPTARVVQHPSAKVESDHQRMMRELASKTGAIPDGKAQGDAVKWLLSHGYTADESVACLEDLLAELRDETHWRKSRVSWLTVRKEIGTWKLRGVENGINGRPQASAGGNPQATRPPTRDEQRIAALSRQSPASILGTPRASALDEREPDRKAASPSGGDYDAGRTAIHFR